VVSRRLTAVLTLGFVAACSFQSAALAPNDGDDTGPDSTTADGAPDARLDGSTPDAALDSSRPDGGAPDTTPPEDTAVPDTTPPMDTAVIDTGCPDGDDDGVCDALDACPGSDDREDVDGDGLPDGCDPCPVDGPTAPAIPTSVTGRGITITNVSLAGGGNVATVNPGDSVPVSLSYVITDCGCTGCIDQIEVGLVPDMSVQYCAYSAVPGCGGDSGTDMDTLIAPSTSGVYSLRFARAQNFGCTHTNWWDGTPPIAQQIGALCVR
jgi:hypothetical protein